MLLYSVLVQMLHRCEPEMETELKFGVNLVSLTNQNEDQTVKNDIDDQNV